MKIKRYLLLFNILLLLFTASCGNGSHFPEVNLQNKMPVQIMYRQVLYNGEISYDGESFILSFSDNETSIDEMSFIINEKQCTIKYNELSKTYNRASLQKHSTPLILYDYFSKLGSEFTFEAENEKYYYIKRVCSEFSVEFRFEKDAQIYYIEIK